MENENVNDVVVNVDYIAVFIVIDFLLSILFKIVYAINSTNTTDTILELLVCN